jgi:hypothetical protein
LLVVESWVVFSLAKLLNDGLDRYEDAKAEMLKFIKHLNCSILPP